MIEGVPVRHIHVGKMPLHIRHRTTSPAIPKGIPSSPRHSEVAARKETVFSATLLTGYEIQFQTSLALCPLA